MYTITLRSKDGIWGVISWLYPSFEPLIILNKLVIFHFPVLGMSFVQNWKQWEAGLAKGKNIEDLLQLNEPVQGICKVNPFSNLIIKSKKLKFKKLIYMYIYIYIYLFSKKTINLNF